MANKPSSNPLSNVSLHGKTLKPLQGDERDAAAAIIRAKLQDIYAEEPKTEDEIIEAEHTKQRSVHQQFMHELVHSGKSLAAIQTAWHTYYIELPEDDKHQVWKEFYDSNKLLSKYHKISDRVLPEKIIPSLENTDTQGQMPKMLAVHPARDTSDRRSAKNIKRKILHNVSAGGTIKAKHHLHSLLFGLGMGAATLLILLFGFFNEVIIAPFIQPSRTASAAPLIVNGNGVAPTSSPEVIIPKINVQIPVDYTQVANDEDTIQAALENGVVHYPTTALPGENGNTAIFGHSSNNIFNNGKYKFAFVLLHKLELGDTFYLTKDGKVFVYKIITKTVVEPSQVEVLNPVAGQTATATLITCDPPGTTLRRLVIVGQQISPAVSSNTASSAGAVNTDTISEDSGNALPGNGPSLFSRIWQSIF